VHDVPALIRWFNGDNGDDDAGLVRRLLPLLASKYGFAVEQLKVKEAFVVKYEAEDGTSKQGKEEGTAASGAASGAASAAAHGMERVNRQQRLPLHRDSSLLSFVISLSSPHMHPSAGGGATGTAATGSTTGTGYDRGYEGGGTRFPALNLTLGLEQGEALLFSGKLAHEVSRESSSTCSFADRSSSTCSFAERSSSTCSFAERSSSTC
jgi:hypothetical protein